MSQYFLIPTDEKCRIGDYFSLGDQQHFVTQVVRRCRSWELGTRELRAIDAPSECWTDKVVSQHYLQEAYPGITPDTIVTLVIAEPFHVEEAETPRETE